MITGTKVILKEVERGNLGQLREWRNNPEVRKFFRAYKDISEDMQDNWYKSIGNNSSDSHVYFQVHDVKVNPSFSSPGENIGELIGVCGLHYINWHIRSAEVSIFIAAKSGSGFGTSALNALCEYGFNELNMHKLWAEIFDNNPASLHLFKKVGFVEEGMLRDNHFSEGKYGNSYRLSILEDEWRK